MTGEHAAGSFWDDGYRIIDGFLPSDQRTLVRQSMELSQRSGKMRLADNAAYRGPNNEYAPLVGQMLLGSLTPKLSALVGRELLPSYAFWRIYEKGAVLNRHKDRKACEVSVTIAIDSDPEGHVWPIGVTDLNGREHRIALSPGAGLLYLGSEIEHWREPLTAPRQYQMFLHYVLADGPFAARANDNGLARVP